MNALSRRILKILEETPIKPVSEHLLRKQCSDLGIEFENIRNEDIPMLAERLSKILPFFIGNSRAEEVVGKIKKLGG
ncbi:MAG: hypothetical protein DRN20_05605 [Thermoplasmata archaeon]|nr:MAG: hypothetical protein DRN20_05605 [Thermoplasmata archaeon]